MRLAVIPARGGSMRIPGKNIRPFAGKPIIAYSIEAARQSGVFDRIIVSTDSTDIAAVARQFGAETPFTRPPELSDAITPTVPVIRHAIEWVASHWGQVDHVCCIYATAPFVSADDIAHAYGMIRDQSGGYVFTATRFGFPIQRAFRIDPHGFCEMFHPEQYNTRSQDLEHAYQDAGQFYWGAADTYRQNVIFFDRASRPYVIPSYRVQDIDTPEDWTRAEYLFRAQAEMAKAPER